MWWRHATRTVGLALGAWLVGSASGCGGSSVLKDDGSGAQGDAGDGNAGTTGGSGGKGSGGKGATGGGGASTGGASTGGASTGGAGGSGTGAGPSHGFGTCEDVRKELDAELEELQACTDASECGLPLKGTSCGCTHDLVARLDADPNRFDALAQIQIDGESCASFGSDCDCPETDGFACIDQRCTWNYVEQDSCEHAPLDTLCLAAEPGVLEVGMQVAFELLPSGCYSSSCTYPLIASCRVERDGDDYKIVEADLCLSSAAGQACTDDCGGGGVLLCDSTDDGLTAGVHTVTYEGPPKLSITFTVPSAAKVPSEYCTSVAR